MLIGIDDYIRVARFGIETAMWVSAPVLLIGLVVGLVVSIFQAATQINDAALAFIPKVGAALASLIIFGPFMMNRLVTYTAWVFNLIPSIIP